MTHWMMFFAYTVWCFTDRYLYIKVKNAKKEQNAKKKEKNAKKKKDFCL